MKSVALLALLIVTLVAVPAFAATQTSITGTVVSSTMDRLVVQTTGGQMTFTIYSGAARPTTLASGNRVTVWYSPGAASGEWSLDKVELAAADLDWDNIRVVTGTVVALEDEGDDLIMSTPKGTMTFDIDSDTERPASIVAGDRLTVWYDADDKMEDNIDARRIVTAPAIVAMVPAATTTTTTYETTAEAAPVEEEEEEMLPATASPLPLIGAIGILALAGVLLLRRRARRS
jgi:hypothetical protein